MRPGQGALKAALAVSLLLPATLSGVVAPGPPLRPDPRTPQLRRVLALHPSEKQAVWISLEARVAASRLPPALSAEARMLRARKGVGILETDRPIAPALVARLRRAGASIRVLDRWSRSVSADLDSATAERIARIPGVKALESVPRLVAQAGSGSVHPARAPAADTLYGLSYGPLAQLDVPAAHGLGYTGRGVRVGMLDSGFDRNHAALKSLRVIAQRDFIYGDTVVRDERQDSLASGSQMFHGTATWALLGGFQRGRFVGPAYGASFILAKTEFNDPIGRDSHADEDRWVQAVQWQDSIGVDIISSSLGYRYDFPDGDYPCSAMDGKTTRTSIAAAALARRRILLVNSIGNDGLRAATCTLSAPADADSIISVGAVDSLGNVWAPSSRGPTADGRTKPDLVARGTGMYYALAGTDSSYQNAASGTSWAAPLIAGSAALVLEAWPGLAPMKIRDALTLNASGRRADNVRGWGIPDVGAAILFPEGLAIAGASPKDAIERLGSVTPTFAWSAPRVLPVPIRYTLQIANDSAFSSVVLSDTTSNASSLTIHAPLRPAANLYWRVTATGPGGITRRTVTSGPLILPHWVLLVDLNQNGRSISESERPMLRWNPLLVSPALGPMLFDVQILDASGNVVSGETMPNISTDSVKVPLPLDYNRDYKWRVIAKVGSVADTVTSQGTFIVTNRLHPPSTTLYQNFPNPFPRPMLGVRSTRIWFDLAAPVTVELAVYDMRGRLVASLIPAKGCGPITLPSGQYGQGRTTVTDRCVQTEWDGADDNGHEMPAGVYLLRLRAGGQTQTRHIIYAP